MPDRTSRSTRAVALAASLLLVGLHACTDDGIGPAGVPELHIVAGAGTSDTIDARPTQAIVVEVRDQNGRPRRGVIVHFADAAPPVLNTVGERVRFLLHDSYGWVTHSVADTTDSAGRAQVWVRTQYFAGERAVEVSLPAHHVVDTARFMVLPGAATGIALEPMDTILLAGTTARLRGAVHDRVGNRRTDAVQWRLLSGGATLGGDGSVTMPAAGFANIEVSSGPWADTSVVFGSPPGTISGFVGNSSVSVSLVLLEVDGTGRRTVLQGSIDALGRDDRVPHWSAASPELYFQLDEPSSASIWAVDTLGRLRRLLDAGTMRWQYRPQPSSDGRWVYFNGNRDPGSDTALWRARSDGSHVEGLATGRTGNDTDMHPAPSPDGTRVVFTSYRSGSSVASLHVLEIATGRVTALGVGGFMPRWSPTGERIAYFDAVRDELRIIQADGTNDRSLGPAIGYPFSWSPDGRWIVGRGGNPSFVIVDASTGARVRVPGTLGMMSPAWLR